MNCSKGQLKLTAKGTVQMAEQQQPRPTATYSKVSEMIRHATSGTLQCSMFCGGSNCKYCNADRWVGDVDTVIQGLYSSWVTTEILATSRPTTFAINNYKIIDQFKTQSIRSIINVQRPGEHASCGRNPLDPDSGFSYSPQDFMENQIFFYNFGWRDYGTASLETILDMVKVMSFALDEGKVAVHCHAGLGRTGVIIACYLIFAHRLTADQAINFIRSKRPGAIQTSGQIDCVQQFYLYLSPLWVMFSAPVLNAPTFTLQQFLKRQRRLLHGFEARQLKYIPKIVYTACSKLVYTACKIDLHLSQQSVTDSTSSAAALAIFYNTSAHSHPVPADRDYLSVPLSLAGRSQSLGDVTKTNGFATVARENRLYPVEPGLSASAESLVGPERNGGLGGGKIGSGMPKPAPSSSPRMSVSSSRNTLNVANSSMKKMKAKRKMMLDTRMSDSQLLLSRRGNVLIKGPGMSRRSVLALDPESFQEDPESVAQAMGFNLLLLKDEAINKRMINYQVELNGSDMAWLTLYAEVDPYVLSAILWAWLEQLKMPVLSAQDLHNLSEQKDSPLKGLETLEKEVYHTVECLLVTVGQLLPLKPDILECIIHRMISALTQSISKPTVPSPRHKDTKPPAVEFFENCISALSEQYRAAQRQSEIALAEETADETKTTPGDRNDPYYVSSSSDPDGVSH